MKTKSFLLITALLSETAFAGVPLDMKPVTFREAAVQATNTSGCQAPMLATIKAASVIDGPTTGYWFWKKTSKVLNVSPGETGDDQFGPLSNLPTQAELRALVGKRMCATKDE